MKTVLIFPPTANPAPSYFGPPYGLALLGAVLERAGQRVAAYDYDRQSVEAMLDDAPRLLAEDRPDLVGISCLSVNRGPGLLLARRFKELAPELPLIFGGPFPTLEPELMLEQSPADLVCIGDGDETLLELVEAMESGRPLAEVAGLALRENGEPRRTAGRRRFTDLDSLPFPNLDLFPVREMIDRHRQETQRTQMARIGVENRRPFITDAFIMVMNSRGCPWQCSFCPLSQWEGRSLFHSPEYVVDMIEHFRDHYDYRTFVFGDNTLTYPKKHAIRLCELMIERELGIEWICMTRADMVDPHVLGLMAKAGCKEISYGVESLSQSVQRAMKKKLLVRVVPGAFEQTHEAGISSCLMMMVGNQGETRHTMRETADLARDIQPDRILINTTKIYPGTDLFDIAQAQGVIPTDYYEQTRDDVFTEAPYYTGENDAEELAHLEGMLRHRTTYLEADAASFDRERLERDLLMAAWRGEHAVLGGGEPLLLPELPELMEFAGENEVHRLRLYTTARPLVRRSARHALRSVNAVVGIIVPLFGMSAEHHDDRMGTPGALLQTRKGMLAWTQESGKLAVWAFLDKYNVALATQWVRWIHEHGANEILFVYGEAPSGWGSVPASELPTLTEAGAAMRRAQEVAEVLGVEMAVSGLPECVAGGGAETIEIHELGRPFDERIDRAGRPIPRALDRRARRSFVSACEDCTMRLGCEGVWTGYLDLRGSREIQPIGSAPQAPAKAIAS